MFYHDVVKEQLRFLNNSEIRLKILVGLSGKSFSLADFKDNSFVSYSSLSTNIYKLTLEGYVEKDFNNKFKLTNLGKIYLISLMEFHGTINTVNKFSEFWLDHNVEALSNKYLKRISDLEGSKLIKSNPTDLYKTHEEFRNMFKDSESLKVIFPYLHPEYPKLIRKLISNGSKVEILVPKVICKRFVKSIGETLVRSSIKNNVLSIRYIDDEVKLALAISDQWVSIGLFKKDGSYDQSRLLISDKKEAVKWAENIFESYDEKAVDVDLVRLK
ncbi:MAG: DUF1724 domain-containing protein [Methanobrevibacter sp.]|nr:DUF1724 domain-containing protein [Methanobrevibacter sp.]